MKPGRPKTQLQLINEDQEFSQDFAQYLSDVWKLEDNGFDYNIVAVFGSQSSGKSTLLNRLFGTEFEVMSTERRRQTTKGIWADKSTYKSNIIVLDVEGTDGSERGEDQEFERKSALFSLAISEVLVVNIWENTVGLYNSANMGLLKTVFEVNLELFGKEKDVKTLLFFSIRDHTSEVTLDALSDTLMHDLESVWERISKPESLKDAKITDYFDFAFSSLPNKPLQPQEFEDRAAKLRGRFIDPKHDNYVFNSKYKRRIPVDGIPHYAASIWEKIVTNKDLDLPTQQELLAQYRCDEISRQVVERFHQEIQPIREAIDSGKPSATENIGGTMAKVRGSAISEFESHASRYQRSVYEKSRQQLLGLLNSDLCILYVRLIKQASNAAVREFSNRVKKRLGSAARSNEEYEFMDIVRKTQDEVRGDFRRLAEETRLPDTDWSYDDEAAHLDQMMDNIIDELRKGEISRIMDRTRNVLKREISDVLAAELNEPTDKMWGTVLGSFAEINAKVERTFSQRIQPIVSEEPARRAMIKQMRELAWGDLVAKAREEVSDQMVLLKLRNYLEERFRYDSQGLPRVWMPSDDIDGQFDRARTETLRLIPGYCKIDVGAWDES
ncbi:Dynamin-like GTPase that mediates homotypic ER fusion, partial [Spiromyces aspiralis]